MDETLTAAQQEYAERLSLLDQNDVPEVDELLRDYAENAAEKVAALGDDDSADIL